MDKTPQGQTDKQFHPPFYAAMELELREDRNKLIFEKEHVLNTKPNTIDLLIIKTDGRSTIHNGLGYAFRKYNLLEYRHPRASLDSRIYHRTLGYANLYIAYHGEKIHPEELSVTLIREARPRGLMEYLGNLGYEISEYEQGIYHCRQKGQIFLQIIVTRKLLPKYKWLTKLTDRLEISDFLSLENEISNLKDARDITNAESVIDIMTKLNEGKAWMKEVRGMGAFRDFFGEPIREEIQKEFQEKYKEQEVKYKEQEVKYKEQYKEQEMKLQEKEDENSRLREEILRLKEQLRQQVKSALL